MTDSTKHIHLHRPSRYVPLAQKALIAISCTRTFQKPVRLTGGLSFSSENLVTHALFHMDEDTWSTRLGDRIPVQACMDPPLPISRALAMDSVG
jgi:hypothetical protein